MHTFADQYSESRSVQVQLFDQEASEPQTQQKQDKRNVKLYYRRDHA